MAVRIMASGDTHVGKMGSLRQNVGEPSRMLGLKNVVYVEVFGDTTGQRLMRLKNAEWRRGEPLRMQVIFACMSLDEIVKLNAKNEAHVQNRQGHGHEVIGKIRNTERSRRTRSAPRRKRVEAAITSRPQPPERIRKKPTSSRSWGTI